MSTNLPPHAALITHPVNDFEHWKVGFDGHEPARRAAGMLGHHIDRAEDDPNLVTLFLALSDLDQAKAFADSTDLADTMERVGVTAPPVIRWMQPVRESIIWDDSSQPSSSITVSPTSTPGSPATTARQSCRHRAASSGTQPTGGSTTRRWCRSTTRPRPSTRCATSSPMPNCRPRCRRPE